MIKKIPNYVNYILLNIGFLFTYLFIFRLVFFFYVADLDAASQKDIVTAFSYGIRFDLKLAILSYFPLSVVILSANYLFFKKNIFRIIATIYHIIIYVSLTIFYLTDIGNYSYLFTRLDATSLRFLSNLKISTSFEVNVSLIFNLQIK